MKLVNADTANLHRWSNCRFSCSFIHFRLLWQTDRCLSGRPFGDSRWSSAGRLRHPGHAHCWPLHCGRGGWYDVRDDSSVLRELNLSIIHGICLTCVQSEVAPPRIRGLLGSMQQWMIGVGIMVAVSHKAAYL